MGLNLSTAKFDETLAREGRWVELSMGGEVRVTRWDTPKARVAENAYELKHRKELQRASRTKDAEEMTEWLEGRDLHVMIEGQVLQEWRGFYVNETTGEEYPFSKKNARDLLSQEDYRWIAREIKAAAMEDADFRMKEKESDMGNSEIASRGTSSGASGENGLNN